MMLLVRLRHCFGAALLSALACQAFASNEGDQSGGGFASPPFPSSPRGPNISPSQPGRAGEPMGGSSGSGGGSFGGTGGSSAGGSNGSGGSAGESAGSDVDAGVGDADVPDALFEFDAASE
jgi:hypothetical protein